MIHIYTYIYERERERERPNMIYIYIYGRESDVLILFPVSAIQRVSKET